MEIYLAVKHNSGYENHSWYFLSHCLNPGYESYNVCTGIFGECAIKHNHYPGLFTSSLEEYSQYTVPQPFCSVRIEDFLCTVYSGDKGRSRQCMSRACTQPAYNEEQSYWVYRHRTFFTKTNCTLCRSGQNVWTVSVVVAPCDSQKRNRHERTLSWTADL